MSDTPRTDAVEVYYIEIVTGRESGMYWVKADFAQQLEQELYWARERIAEMQKEIKDLEREVRDAARDAAAEERWKATQGDDYGSY